MTKTNHTELFEKLLLGFCQEDDPMQSMLKWITDQLMEVEVSSLVTESEKGKHNTERKTHRNGYRVRRWDTRMGTIYLTIPKVRQGGYQPFFLVNRQQSETALMSVIQECWVNGISTRKMKRVFKSFGVEDISAGQVSRMTKDLEKEVNKFRTADLSASYPVIWIDAVYEKIRMEDKVCSVAIMVAMGINMEGKKEILAIETMENESTETWTFFFEKLQARGLKTVNLVVSDAHRGIQTGLKTTFTGSTWQRCKVHFMRNILARVSHKHKSTIGRLLSLIFTQDSYKEAKQTAEEVIEKFKDRFPEAMDVLSEGIEDALQFFHFKHLPANRISSTNHLERLNKEIRRRSNVVGIFPSTASYLRLIGSYLLEYQADWHTSKAYINPDRLTAISLNQEVLMAA